jgi:hypothetical protein
MVKRYVVTGDPMESPYGFWVEYGEVKGLAERCERLEGALRHCENMLMKFDINRIDGEEISDETLGVIRSALSGSSGGKDG